MQRRRAAPGDRSAAQRKDGSASLQRPPAARKGRPPNDLIRVTLCPPYGTARFWAAMLLLALAAGFAVVSTDWSRPQQWWLGQLRPRGPANAITPLTFPKVTDLPQFGGDYKERMLWGTYRSQQYFGMRMRSPQSLLGGLMWLAPKPGGFDLRHVAEEGNRLPRYGWVCHDGVSYGRQEILDQGFLIQMQFLKEGPPTAGYGGDWAARISVAVAEDLNDYLDEDERTFSLLFYLVAEGGEPLYFGPIGSRMSDSHGMIAEGTSPVVGPWQLHTTNSGGVDVNLEGLRTRHVHNLTALITQELGEQLARSGRLQLPNTVAEGANMAIVQMTGKAPFEVDFVFATRGASEDDQLERVVGLSKESLSEKLAAAEAAFHAKFAATFPAPPARQEGGEESVAVVKTALSNLLGGMGYFYGRSRIAIPEHLKKDGGPPFWLYWPAQLYTAVPSRSFFPRGFLWDEGFHQLIVSRWDPKMSMDVIGHWLDLMNADGWIPREQILGEEARSKVPEEFVLQHTSNANPPTLFLPLRELAGRVERAEGTAEELAEVSSFLERSFPRLEAWYRWFNTTQLGEVEGSYYWHGRDAATERELNPKTLMSGLDDYPRASHPTAAERHVDLRCWMALASEAMAAIARLLGLPHQAYAATAERLQDLHLLNKLHLHKKTGAYLDFGNHTEAVALRWAVHEDPRTGRAERALRRHVARAPRPRLVPQFGYNSLFPLLMRLLPPASTELGVQLKLLREEGQLWTPHGLRSLSANSSLYMKYNTEHDAPYWRGPVWININYLTLAALKHYGGEDGPHKTVAMELYEELRGNIVRNIVKQYYATGYLWENYDAANGGIGKGSHPFTGWTALIVLIFGEVY